MELHLTKSQRDVVRLKALGYSEKQIADIRYNSIHTVKMHVKRALRNNAVSNGFELVARYAARNPQIFRTVVSGLFLAIQFHLIYDISDIERARKSKTKTNKTSPIGRRGRQNDYILDGYEYEYEI